MPLNLMKNVLPTALAFILFISMSPVSIANAAISPLEDQKQVQRLLKAANDIIGNKVGDYTFIDQDGNSFKLSEFRDKPLIISFIYTSCPAVCPTITGSISAALDKAGKDWGDHFNILTVGIDTANDTPAAMKEHAGKFIKDFSHWKFASMSNQEEMDRFLREFRFYYIKLGEGNFDHINMITFLDGRGIIYRHIYGMTYKPEDIMAALDDIRIGKKPSAAYSGFVGGLKLFCSVYDPDTKAYEISYAVLLNYALQGILLFGLLYFTWIKSVKGYIAKRRNKS